MSKKAKIIILTIPYSGHINPTAGIAYELAKKNIEVIFYGNKEHKEIIEATGSEFRCFSYYPTTEFINKTKDDNNKDIDWILDGWYFLDVSSRMLNELVNMVEQEKPDLILYDILAVQSRYLLQHFIQKNTPIPAVVITTTFETEENLYPNHIEESDIEPFKHNLKSWYYVMLGHLKQISFSFKYDFKIKNPINYMVESMGDLNLVTVHPELQPRSHLFHKRNKFVGNCISEKVRSSTKTVKASEDVETLLSKFDPVNPLKLAVDDYFLSEDFNFQNKRLIYVSLGTVFNNNLEGFLKIIDGLNAVESDQFEFDVLISCGKDVLKAFEQKKVTENYQVPTNFHLVQFAPQIEVLKRASLFITHSGMNSISESIQYGVPVICVPLSWDQPRVAYRVCDELGCGIRIPFNVLNSEKIRDAAETILNDKSYTERILRNSQISLKSNGCLNSANIIEKYIQNTSKSS